jgi:hypothetical protein
MSRYFRIFHRRVLPFLFPLIALTALTGMIYRVGRAWFGMDRTTGDLVLNIHTGGWMGDGVSPFYVLLVGFSLLAALLTGGAYLVRKGGGGWLRRSHRLLGLVFLLPLLVTAGTGILFEAGETWLHFPESTSKLLMTLHEGRWLGKGGRVYYVLVTGSALLGVGVIGLALWGSRKKAN